MGRGRLDLFPGLEADVREQSVSAEVCPISNQALRYVKALRRHPARGRLRRGMHCTLSSDDPGLFGNAKPSDDFAVAYSAWGLVLATLKQLALEFIRESTLPATDKQRQLTLFESRWSRRVAGVCADAATVDATSNGGT
jgi:adenosine deaminase CECR1